MQFINDRNAAYSFITKELNIYDGKYMTHIYLPHSFFLDQL